MILLLLGPDAYRKRQRRVAAIVGFGVPTHQSLSSSTGQAVDVTTLDADTITIQALDDALLSLGLFATKRAVIVPDVGALPKAVASRLVQLLPTIQQPGSLISDVPQAGLRVEDDPPSQSSGGANNTLLILEAEKLDQRTELAKAVKKLPTETFEPLQGAALERWIGEQVKTLGVSIEPDARRLLIERVGPDSWRLRSELEKLATAALPAAVMLDRKGDDSSTAPDQASSQSRHGSLISDSAQGGSGSRMTTQKTPRITLAHVKELTLATTSPNLFALTDALIAQNGRAARISLSKLLAGGEAPLGILGLLGYHLRTLALVKDADETGSPVKLHPFVVSKHRPLARRVSWPTIADWYERLAAYDEATKTGTMEPVVALELMVHELSAVR